MFNDIRSYTLGSHAWLWLENDPFTIGTDPDDGSAIEVAGFAAADHLPHPTDPLWPIVKHIGDVEQWEDSKKVETTEVRIPNPGFLTRKEIITWFQGLEFKLVSNSLKRIAMQIYYGSAVALGDDTGTFKPLAAEPPNAWLKLQRYTQKNDLVFAADIWCRVDVTGGVKGGNGEIVKPEYTCMMLDSALNTIFFGDPALLA